MPRLVNQPSGRPTRKARFAGVAGALSTLIISVLSMAGVDLGAEAASSITALIMAGFAWFTREEDPMDGYVKTDKPAAGTHP